MADVLALESIKCHEEVREKLVEYHEGMGACAFFSHTWLRRAAPDSVANEKCALLKDVLAREQTDKIGLVHWLHHPEGFEAMRKWMVERRAAGGRSGARRVQSA